MNTSPNINFIMSEKWPVVVEMIATKSIASIICGQCLTTERCNQKHIRRRSKCAFAIGLVAFRDEELGHTQRIIFVFKPGLN